MLSIQPSGYLKKTSFRKGDRGWSSQRVSSSFSSFLYKHWKPTCWGHSRKTFDGKRGTLSALVSFSLSPPTQWPWIICMSHSETPQSLWRCSRAVTGASSPVPVRKSNLGAGKSTIPATEMQVANFCLYSWQRRTAQPGPSWTQLTGF